MGSGLGLAGIIALGRQQGTRLRQADLPWLLATVVFGGALGPVLRSAVGAVERVVQPERVYVASYGERIRHVHFFLLPRTTALPAGHVVSDVYRRARTLLRSWGLLRNPSADARAETAGRIRESDLWKRSSI